MTAAEAFAAGVKLAGALETALVPLADSALHSDYSGRCSTPDQR
ncbi:hypothetical protein [Rhodococcus wratislaviensis]